jgi:hypothetical protein
MITGPRSVFEALCQARGYSLEDVRPCIVQQGEHSVTVDETHPSYPKKREPEKPQAGPGSELKRLLGRIGIKARPGCACNRRAKHMDKMGARWCRDNIQTICQWLKEEATGRGLPFLESAARALVLLAIRRAEKKGPRQAAGQT